MTEEILTHLYSAAANAADLKLLSSASAQNHRLSRHRQLLPALEQADFFTARHRVDFSAAQRLIKNHPVQLARFAVIDSPPIFCEEEGYEQFYLFTDLTLSGSVRQIYPFDRLDWRMNTLKKLFCS